MNWSKIFNPGWWELFSFSQKGFCISKQFATHVDTDVIWHDVMLLEDKKKIESEIVFVFEVFFVVEWKKVKSFIMDGNFIDLETKKLFYKWKI